MTREVAEKIARGIADKIECNTADIDDWAEFWGFTREEYEEFLDLTMKALEQEPILDKIREQITSNLRGVEIALEVLAGNHPLRQKMEGAKDTLEDCLELIDKAESEE